MKRRNNGTRHLKTVGVCMGVVVVSSALLHAQTDSPNTSTNSIEKLAKENQSLKKRLDALEAMAQKEGLIPSANKADPPVSAFSEISLSGFVTTSFFHDSSDPPASIGHRSPGYLWNRVNDSFTLNKVK